MPTLIYLLVLLAAATGCFDRGRTAESATAVDSGAPAEQADALATPADATDVSCTSVWKDVERGTSLDDEVWSLTTDASGNIYAGGFEHGVNGVTNIDPEGDARGVVMQFDPTGTLGWTAVIDTAGADTIEDVAIEPATNGAPGRIFAVGRTSGAFDSFVNHGERDTILAVLDPHGGLSTVFQTGDERPQHPLRLALGSSNELVVAGYDDTYSPNNAVESWDDGFVERFDRGGASPSFTQTFLLKVPLDVPNQMTGVAIDRDGTGNMYVSHFGSGPPATAGMRVSKLDAAGSVLWSSFITATPIDVVNAIALSPANELFVTGATAGTVSGTNAGLQDAFVMKLDKATGNIEWAVQAGSRESDYPTALDFDASGNIYIAGETFGSVVPALNHGGLDVFAMKFDPAGTLLSSWQTGTPADELVTSVVVDRCGVVLVGGYTKGALVDGSTGGQRMDMIIVRAAL